MSLPLPSKHRLIVATFLVVSWTMGVRTEEAGAQDAVASTADAGVAAPRAHEPPRGDAPKPHLSPTDVTLVVQYPKWEPKGAGANTGFALRYREDKAIPGAWLKADISDGGSYWLVTFPSRPEAGVVVRLESMYQFELTEASTARIKGEIVAAIAQTAEVIAAALVDAKAHDRDLKEAVRERRDDLESALLPLRRYWTEDERNAREILLETLGLSPLDERDRAGAWDFDEAKLYELSEKEALAIAMGSAASLSKHRSTLDLTAAKEASELLCKKRIEAYEAPNTEQALSILEACTAAAVHAQSTAKADVDAQVAGLRTFAAGTYVDVAALNGKFAEITAAADFTKLASGWTSDVVSYAWQSVKAAKTEELAKASLKGGLLGIVQERWVLEETKPSDALLSIEARRRWYDVSTGFVYVGGVKDVVVPTLLSICPNRCMKTDSGSSDYWGYRYNFSVDFGVKAAILDKNKDPRHEDTIAFLLGGSYNPIDILRISAGMYLFENSASKEKDWNVNGYVGMTVNVLQAAELLGALGMSKIPKASIEVPGTSK